MSIRLTITLLALALFATPAYGQTQAQKGAVAGGIAGAILGGVAGHQNDETPEGIAIGGAVGAIAGSLLGRSHDNKMVRDYQYQQQRVHQQAQRVRAAVSINDVITLAQSGVSDGLIINQMKSNGVRKKIGVNEIILMHQNGVSEPVIDAMQKIGSGAAPAIATTNQKHGYERPVVVHQPTFVERPIVVPPYRPVYRPQPTIVIDHYRSGYQPRSGHRHSSGYYRR